MARLDQHPQTAHTVRFYDPATGVVCVLMTGAEGSHEAQRVATAWAEANRPTWRPISTDGADWMTLDVATVHGIVDTIAPTVCASCGGDYDGDGDRDTCSRCTAEDVATAADALDVCPGCGAEYDGTGRCAECRKSAVLEERAAKRTEH